MGLCSGLPISQCSELEDSSIFRLIRKPVNLGKYSTCWSTGE